MPRLVSLALEPFNVVDVGHYAKWKWRMRHFLRLMNFSLFSQGCSWLLASGWLCPTGATRSNPWISSTIAVFVLSTREANTHLGSHLSASARSWMGWKGFHRMWGDAYPIRSRDAKPITWHSQSKFSPLDSFQTARTGLPMTELII